MKQQYTITVTRKEFLTLPMPIRRKALKEMAARSIHGAKITKKQALKGLGNPKTWEAFRKKVMKEFRRKPTVVRAGGHRCPCNTFYK